MKSNWKQVKLGEVCSKIGDGLHGTPKYDESGSYFFINGNNLVNGKIFFKQDTKKVNETEYLKYRKELNNRTLFVSINGTLGNVAEYNQEKCILGKSACYLNVSEDMSKKFIKYILFSPHFQFHISHTSTGTTIKNVSLKTIREYEFSLPPLETQKQIAKTLSSIDDKIELNNVLNDNLEQQAQAIFKSWFVDFEPFGGVMPADWEIGAVSNLGKVVGGSTPSKAKEEYYTTSGIPWITPKDLSIDKSKFTSKGSIDITEFGLKNSSASIMPKGTVLFSSRAPIGYIAIAKNNVTTNQGFKSIVPFENIGTAYTYFFLKHNIETVESMASGSTFKEVSASVMRTVPAIIPDDGTLSRFTTLCQPIFEQQEKLEHESKLLAQLRDTLLPKLMSGEIDVSQVEV